MLNGKPEKKRHVGLITIINDKEATISDNLPDTLPQQPVVSLFFLHIYFLPYLQKTFSTTFLQGNHQLF